MALSLASISTREYQGCIPVDDKPTSVLASLVCVCVCVCVCVSVCARFGLRQLVPVLLAMPFIISDVGASGILASCEIVRQKTQKT